MRNELSGNGLVCVVVVMFVGISVMPITEGLTVEKRVFTENKMSCILINTRGDILYVGGSGPGNYSSIQAAINDAENGDTVFVFDDSSPYYEHVKVDKTINLIGENMESPSIDGGGWGTVVELSADGVIIAGFTIGNGDYMKGVFVNSKNNIITGNNIINNGWIGIYITGSSNTISENTIKNNYHYGMWIDPSSNSNSIYNNTISKNKQGIHISVSKNNTISGNSIKNNREEGIYISGGSSKNIITENTVTHNGQSSGIYMIGVYNSVISANDLTNNNRGIYLHSSSNNIFSRNTITNNAWDGIHLWRSSGNNITENNIANHFECGLILRSSAKNTITGNAITNNKDYGIHLVFNSSYNNSIYHNDFIDNNQNALDNSDIENYFDDDYPSGGNYWDDYIGEDSDGDGIGDTPYPIPGGDNEDRYPLMESCCGFPYAPTITGPTNGKPGIEYNYTFVATDPNNDDLYYYIDLGDGTDTDWFGPYPSGEEVKVNHTWSEKGEYALKARAKDTDDLLSPWGILTVTMPKNKQASHTIFFQFLERFANRFQLWGRLLNLE